MKKFAFFALLTLILPIISLAQTRHLSEIDGNEWRTWEKLSKVRFVTGFMLGSAYVVCKNMPLEGMYVKAGYDPWRVLELYWRDFMGVGVGTKKKEQFSREEASLLLERERRIRKEHLDKYLIIEITNTQIVDGLDLFYNDFRNRQIKLPEAVFLVKKQILGASKEEFEAITEWLRTPDRDSGKLQFKDKDGNVKYAQFP